jgi:protein transport protein SEC61 subunit gamma-like protein
MLGAIISMGLGSFARSAVNTLKLARKSDWTEFSLYLKLVVLGVGVVGTIGYIIQSIGAFFQLG